MPKTMSLRFSSKRRGTTITILTAIKVATVRVTKVRVATTRNGLIQGCNDKKVDATMRLESGQKTGDKQ